MLIGGNEELGKKLADGFNCKLGKFPLLYLGVPIRHSGPLKEDWLLVIAEVERKLSSWKGQSLFKGGRLVLVNSLSPIPLCMMSVFAMPGWVRERTDHIRRSSLWGGQ